MRTLAVSLAASLLAAFAAGALADDRSTLTGIVRRADGQPIANATVILWTAGLREGYSTYCPSCYADCGKSAHTDAAGAFKIDGLDPTLIFRVVVTADGFRPMFVTKVDPAGKAIEVALEARSIGADAEKKSLRGRVLDPRGTPIRFAVVTPGHSSAGADPVAVTNERGEFVLCSAREFTSMDVTVAARGYAKAKVAELAPGAAVHDIVVREGARIRGRVIHSGRPVANVLVGAAQVERGIGSFFGEETVGTDAEGRFTIESVPVAADTFVSAVDSTGKVLRMIQTAASDAQRWNVYAKMESIKSLGASDMKSCVIDADGKTIDIGDIELKPGLSLSGRVVLSDGAGVPSGMHITAGIDAAWDVQTVDIAPDGSFVFSNLPPGECEVFASVKGYFLSRRNPSISWSLEGTLDRDIRDFSILMEPGKEEFDGLAGGRNRGKPLTSIDAQTIAQVIQSTAATRPAD